MDIDLKCRVQLLSRLGKYMVSADETWLGAKDAAVRANPWFTEKHVALAIHNIAIEFLDENLLNKWVVGYNLPITQVRVGIVMAGNIPLVGFHDFLCGFVAGHRLAIKLSSKDEILLQHLIGKLVTWEPSLATELIIAERLNGCDAYIATGSNNTARYFHTYFGKYPHIIRKNRTSVAVLDGNETRQELELLADDVFLYFGLGCRNVTQVCVPKGYNFEPLLQALDVHQAYFYNHKYKNNFDYHLAIFLLNRVPYITNESILLVENNVPFSAVSVLHYRYYADKEQLKNELLSSDEIQSVTGHGFMPFGQLQRPGLGDYADGADTMSFLCGLGSGS